MSLASTIKQQLIANLSLESSDPNASLNNSLRLLSKWRSLIPNRQITTRKTHGRTRSHYP
jgi:hypothetical protein